LSVNGLYAIVKMSKTKNNIFYFNTKLPYNLYILTAKSLSSQDEYAGHRWYYNFRRLNKDFKERVCLRVRNTICAHYSKITKTFDDEKYSEWMCRTYLSAKMIMIATLQLNALQYAKEKNLRLVMPYLEYYSLLALSRAIVYMRPQNEWNNGELVKIGHTKAINEAMDYVSQFDKEMSQSIKEYIFAAKASRELITYRAPSSGDKNLPPLNKTLDYAVLLSEIVQFNSELLEKSVLKNAEQNRKFVFENSFIDKLSKVEIDGHTFFDCEDARRLDYLRRKCIGIPNILFIMTEGHTEDFFGAWYCEELSEDLGLFNPDEDTQIIFDIP
jgi:hypothetical protein